MTKEIIQKMQGLLYMASGVKGKMHYETLADYDRVKVWYKTKKGIIAEGEVDGVDDDALFTAWEKAFFKAKKYNETHLKY